MRPTSHGVEILQPVKVQHCLTHMQTTKPLLNHTFFIDSDPDDTATDSAEELFDEPTPVGTTEVLHRQLQPIRSPKRTSNRSSATSKKRSLRRNDARGNSSASNGPQMLRRSLESASDCEPDDLPSSPKIEQRALQSRERALSTTSRTSTVRPVTAIKPAVDELDQNEVRTWSTAQVAAWLQTSGFENEVVSKFRSNDIDGPALLDLHIKDLKDLDIRSVGKRHAIWGELRALRERDGIPPMPTPSDSERSDAENVPADLSVQRVLARKHSSRRSRRQSQTNVSRTQSTQSRKAEDSQAPISRMQSNRSTIAGGQTHAPPSIAASSDIQGPGTCPTFEFETDLLHLYARDPRDDADFAATQNEPRAKTQQATVTPPSGFVPSPVSVGEMRNEGQSPNESTVSQTEQPARSELAAEAPAKPARTAPKPPSPIKPIYPPRSSSRHFANKMPGAFPTHSVMNSPASSRGPSPTSPQRPVLSLRSPASDTDLPVLSPIQPHLFERDSSQSVPADMQYRHPVFRSQTPSPVSPDPSNSPSSPRPTLTRTKFSSNGTVPRRPLVLMPTVTERNTIVAGALSASRSPTISPIARSSTARTSMTTKAHNMKPLPRAPHVRQSSSIHSVPRELPVSTANAFQASTIYGPGTVRAGWVRKRRNRLWRHEWQEHHFRLQGTRLALHATAKPKDSAPHEVIDVEGYAVACSTIGRGGRLATAMKTLRISSRDSEKAYAWQLVPASAAGDRNRRKPGDPRRRRSGSSGSYHGLDLKTHHFSVKTRDERIEWMREVMLAKAVKQRQTIQLDREKSKGSKAASTIASPKVMSPKVMSPRMASSPVPSTPTTASQNDEAKESGSKPASTVTSPTIMSPKIPSSPVLSTPIVDSVKA